ncbi:MAG: PKD domain-containing protein [Bacteroidetes bacterium]|nr:PKD domain-containing protein [Bacteroidota bacterium]
MIRTVFTLTFCFITLFVAAQSVTKRVLFIGNSYVYTNNLPQELANVAASMGDEVIFDSNAPGGYTFELHSTNTTTLSKIATGTWDYVVLQEQSQIPSFPIDQVETECFPFATILNDSIIAANACTETVFFMTWGRKEGDAGNCPFWPPVCTYSGMDSLLNLRYRMMAEDNEALLSPVGQVWHYIRDNHPEIELYNADMSHPSSAGTYAAAITFYSLLFQKAPNSIVYNGTLSSTDATAIKNAAQAVVFDSLEVWHVYDYLPKSEFDFYNSGVYAEFSNYSTNADSYLWKFGDGTESVEVNPTHTYPAPGSYNIGLYAMRCGLIDSSYKTITTATLAIADNNPEFKVNLVANPVHSILSFQVDNYFKIQCEIYNYTGTKILDFPLQANSVSYPLEGWQSGSYLLVFRDEQGIVVNTTGFIKF